VTKRFSWEVDKASLILRIADGDRKTEWVLRKSTPADKLKGFLGEMILELNDGYTVTLPEGLKPFTEWVRTVDAEELAELQADKVTEEMSKAALKAKADAVHMNTGKWYDNQANDLEELPIYTIGHGGEAE
jgi:hypothetical protein